MKGDYYRYEVNNEDPSEKKRFIQRLFDEIVPTYDFLNHFLSMGIDRGWRRKVRRIIGRQSPGRVLDLCCGTGDLTRVLRRGKVPVVSLDFSIEMLKKGRQRQWLPESTVAADATKLPFRDDTFDAMTIAFGIRNIPDLDVFFSETHRCLTPGGTLVILELTRPENRLVRGGYNFYLHRLLPFIGGLVSGKRDAYRYLSSTIDTFVDSDDLARRARGAGYRTVSKTPLTFGIASIVVCTA